ncbi:MAG: hypothetical protein AAGK66_07190 [Pseudomonadota bacterium]
MSKRGLGYSAEELSNGPFAAYYNPDIAPVQDQVAEALMIGGQAHELLPPVEFAKHMTDPGYGPVETGIAYGPDSSLRIYCLTKMPGVTPQMWDWWFGWHGCEARRYKLWHPKAHIEAKWADGSDDDAYIGRTSLITEYLGSKKMRAAISFVRPTVLGIDEERLVAQGEVAICARLGMPGIPLKAGWLLHHLRPVEDGCEMRSRMWMGGRNIGFGNRPGAVGTLLSFILRPFAGVLLPKGNELLAHNAQEMAHLAGFLPQLYADFGPHQQTGAS